MRIRNIRSTTAATRKKNKAGEWCGGRQPDICSLESDGEVTALINNKKTTILLNWKARVKYGNTKDKFQVGHSIKIKITSHTHTNNVL